MEATRRLRLLLALLRFCSWPAARRHPGRPLLVVGAVALGVGAVVATGSLVESTIASFEASVRATGGEAELRVANGFVGVPEELVDRVRSVPGVATAGGIVSARVRLPPSAGPAAGAPDLLLLGIDLLGEDTLHRSALPRERMEVPDETALLTRVDAVVLDREWAALHRLGPGAAFAVRTPAGPRELHVAGLLDPGPAAALLGGAIGVMDLPALQLLLGREALVDAIDVAIAPGGDVERVAEQLRETVSGLATVSPTGRGDAEGLLFNLRLILNIAGMMAIVMSFLVMYHAVSLEVSQRQPETDTIRSIGVSSRAIRTLFMVEALLIATCAVASGTALGAALAWTAKGLFSSSVTALYTTLTTPSFRISQRYVVLGAVLGAFVTGLASFGAARGRTSLGTALLAASPRHERRKRARRAAGLGVVLLLGSAALTWLQRPTLSVDSLVAAVTGADVLLLAGLALLTPTSVLLVAPLVERLLRHRARGLPLLAWRGIHRDPGRSATVLSALMVGTTYAIITVVVVASLRSFVVGFVERSFRADLTVSAEGYLGAMPVAPPLPLELGDRLRAHPGVARVEALRVVTQPYRGRWIVVAVRDADALGTAYPVKLLGGDLERARQALRAGTGIVASGHFVGKFGLAAGDEVELRTPSGPARFALAAIIEDFTADLGTVFVAPVTFQRLWRDASASSFDVWAAAGVDAGALRTELLPVVQELCACEVLTGAQFRQAVIGTVDVAFQTAYALEVVAAVVMVVSVMSFFVLTLGERGREMGMLRSVGASRAQLLRLFLFEAAGIGLIGGALGCAAGLLVSYRLVRTSMWASGGLQVDYVVPGWVLPAMLLAAVFLSLLSCLPPVLRMTSSQAAAGVASLDE